MRAGAKVPFAKDWPPALRGSERVPSVAQLQRAMARQVGPGRPAPRAVYMHVVLMVVLGSAGAVYWQCACLLSSFLEGGQRVVVFLLVHGS